MTAPSPHVPAPAEWATKPCNDHVDLRMPHLGLTCRLWAHGRPNDWRFTVRVVDRARKLIFFATGGPEDAVPRVDRNEDGSRSLWLASACIELRGEADALAAEHFIAQHAARRRDA